MLAVEEDVDELALLDSLAGVDFSWAPEPLLLAPLPAFSLAGAEELPPSEEPPSDGALRLSVR